MNDQNKSNASTSQFVNLLKQPVVIIGIVVVAFIVGRMNSGDEMPAMDGHTDHEMTEMPMDNLMHDAANDANIEYWSCSMHPEEHHDQAGACSVCKMDLTPVYADAMTGDDHPMSMPENGDQ